ncbi:MAG: MBL fold metallo-hydrolase [Chloroflexi bacterium]|nr:MBL fold metallo-hydrolase [Chloroflexota bacterium]
MKLVSDLHAYVWDGNDNNCNTYVFARCLKDGRHVVIDPGHIVTPYVREPGLDRLTGGMEEDGLDAKDIGLVIATHGHTDHCEAADALRQRSGALVALHQADEPLYRRCGEAVDVYLEEGDLELGADLKLGLRVYHSPGHSPGHIALYWPAEKALIGGDVIFHRATGRVDLPGGSAKLLQQSISRLSELDVEYLLCGHPYGHPGIIEGREAVRRNFDYVKRNMF